MARLALVCATLSCVLWFASWPRPLFPGGTEANEGFPNVALLRFQYGRNLFHAHSEVATNGVTINLATGDANNSVDWAEIREDCYTGLYADVTVAGSLAVAIRPWFLVIKIPYPMMLLAWVFVLLSTARAIRFKLIDVFLAATTLCLSLVIVRMHFTMALALPLLLVSLGTATWILGLAMWLLIKSRCRDSIVWVGANDASDIE